MSLLSYLQTLLAPKRDLGAEIANYTQKVQDYLEEQGALRVEEPAPSEPPKVESPKVEPPKPEPPKEKPEEGSGIRYSVGSNAPSGNIRYSICAASPKAERYPSDYFNLEERERLLMNVQRRVQQVKVKTFVEVLRGHIYRQNLIGPEVYRSAQIDKRLYSKIISNAQYKPSRETAIALALVVTRSLADAKALLSSAGYTLSEHCRRDVILTYFLETGVREVAVVNGVLEALGEALLGKH